MAVLEKHQVTDDRMTSTDWTAIGTRILEAATIASAIHLDELAARSQRNPALNGKVSADRAAGWNREISDGNR